VQVVSGLESLSEISMKQYLMGLIAIFLASLFFAGIGQAATKKEMGVVINLAGKQRMLTQKMSKDILLIGKGVYVDDTKISLKASAELFEKTLKGLAVGDASLGLPETTDKAILAQLDKVGELWDLFRKNVDAVLAGDASKSIMERVAKQNLPLLKEMNKAVQMYADMSGSNLEPAMAATINLAGKQRMLTQKMTKELFLCANDIDADANQVNLKKTAALFERTLAGLLDGDEELGLPGTEDEAIRDQLRLVDILWSEYKPILFAADTSVDGLAIAAEVNLPLLEQMNIAVKMYEESVR